ncbi:MAG TPA: EI24 domain-containing protein [Burkholderiales bacterium]|nr:EI24 domain-containing protein [Burkholderiales bacterium]
MDAVILALIGALRSVVHPIILMVLLVPMLVALVLWVGLGWAYWDAWTSVIQDAVVGHSHFAWAANWDIAGLASWITAALVFALLVPVVIVTALLMATLFAMPVLVRHVARRDYPNLARRRGGTLFGSIWNAVAAIFLFALLWIVTLPLWLLAPLAVLLPVMLSAFLNQRLFRYDALSDHADAAEMKLIFESARGRLFLLGLITGGMYFIPPLNLVAPVFSALAFIHLCLAELQRLRAGEREIAGEVLPAVQGK